MDGKENKPAEEKPDELEKNTGETQVQAQAKAKAEQEALATKIKEESEESVSNSIILSELLMMVPFMISIISEWLRLNVILKFTEEINK